MVFSHTARPFIWYSLAIFHFTSTSTVCKISNALSVSLCSESPFKSHNILRPVFYSNHLKFSSHARHSLCTTAKVVRHNVDPIRALWHPGQIQVTNPFCTSTRSKSSYDSSERGREGETICRRVRSLGSLLFHSTPQFTKQKQDEIRKPEWNTWRHVNIIPVIPSDAPVNR